MKSFKLIVIICLGAVVMLTMAPAGSVTAEVNEDPDGKEMYLDECKSCHGKKGRGNGRAGRDMDPRPTDITDPEYFANTSREDMIAVIMEGEGEMDPYKDVFTTAQIDSILVFMEQLMEKRKK